MVRVAWVCCLAPFFVSLSQLIRQPMAHEENLAFNSIRLHRTAKIYPPAPEFIAKSYSGREFTTKSRPYSTLDPSKGEAPSAPSLLQENWSRSFPLGRSGITRVFHFRNVYTFVSQDNRPPHNTPLICPEADGLLLLLPLSWLLFAASATISLEAISAGPLL